MLLHMFFIKFTFNLISVFLEDFVDCFLVNLNLPNYKLSELFTNYDFTSIDQSVRLEYPKTYRFQFSISLTSRLI